LSATGAQHSRAPSLACRKPFAAIANMSIPVKLSDPLVLDAHHAGDAMERSISG
jgi:hypothetical protein